MSLAVIAGASAFSTRLTAAGVASSNTRHTVGADATGPNIEAFRH
jgi:hypothetical protein